MKTFWLNQMLRGSRLGALISLSVILLVHWQFGSDLAPTKLSPGSQMYFRQAHYHARPYEPLVFITAKPIKTGKIVVQGIPGETVIRGHALTYYPAQLYPFGARLQVKVEACLIDESRFEGVYSLEVADFSAKIWVEVDEAHRPQLVRIWQGDQPLRIMVCSTGRADAPTPEGVFHLKDRGRSFWSRKYQEGGHFWVRISGNYLFHSVPFGPDGRIKPEQATKLGTAASHGCIRLSLADAEWFYHNLPTGAYVIIRKDIASIPSFTLDAKQAPGNVLTLAMATDVVRLDPHDTSDNPSAIINLHIYDTLFELTSSGEVKPALALSAVSLEGGQVWEVQLRRGVIFQDGTPLTSREVHQSFTRLLDPANQLARRGFFAQYISEVHILGQDRLRFLLSRPIAAFPFLLAHTSAAIVKETDPAGSPAICGTGPYRLERWDPGYQVVLAKSKYQWRVKPAFSHICFKVVPEGSSRAVLLETGMVDAAFPLSPMEAARLHNVDGIRVLSHPSHRIIYIGFNLAKPAFANPILRQAFNYAIDKDAIITNLLGGLGEQSGSPLAPSVTGFVPIEPYPYDPLKARRLLAQSDLPNRTIELWAPMGRYLQDAKVAEAITGYLGKLGITIELKLWEWSTYMAALNRNRPDWDLFLLGWVPATGEAHLGLMPLFTANSRSNLTFYEDPMVEVLIQEALGCPDASLRQQLYTQVQQSIHDAAPWIFLYAQEQTVGIRENLAGVEISPTEVISFRQAWRRDRW